MNDDRRHDDRDRAAALQALRRLPRARADDEARRRARAAFVDGVEVRELRPAVSRGARGLRAALLAAALLGALAVMIWGMQPSDHWVVTDAVGVPQQVGDRQEGAVLATGPGEELELQLGERLRFRMLPETEVVLPSPLRRLFGGSQRLTLRRGEIYGTTGGRRLSPDFVFATGELTARITGTTFAVFRTDEASCVCLWEGGITVAPRGGGHDPVVLAPQQRVWVYRDGRAPEVMPLSDMERMKLEMTADAGLVETP